MLIVLSGSTCTGKSAIGRLLADQCTNVGTDTVFLNETSIHSAALSLMFREPEKHAFIVQCEFVVRRTTQLLWALRHHTNVVIERYINDDRLFEEYWWSKKAFGNAQHDAYQRLWQECREMLPKPDCTVFVRCKVETATSRLLERECLAGEAREVPESFVRQYVLELAGRYDDYVARDIIKADMIVNSDEETLEVAAQKILQTIPHRQ